jgi:hypothetical protein
MHRHDPAHQLLIGEVDEVEDAAAEERVGQLLLVVAGDDHHRALRRDDLVAGLLDAEAHPIELVEQIVRELDVGLVDLVDEQHDALLRRRRPAERAQLDVAADVLDVPVAEARVVEALDRVVDVEAVLARVVDFTCQVRSGKPQGFGDGLGEERLARAGLAPHEQRLLRARARS